MVERVVLSCDWALDVSNSVPRPASSRACVSFNVSVWLMTLRCGYIELSLLAAKLEVGPGDLGDDRYLRVVEIGFGALQLRVVGFDVAADPAEEVELPGGIEAGVVIRSRQLESRTRLAGASCSVWPPAAVTVGARSKVDSRRAARASTRCPRAMRRSWFASKRVADELVQGLIVELRPELRTCGSCAVV